MQQRSSRRFVVKARPAAMLARHWRFRYLMGGPVGPFSRIGYRIERGGRRTRAPLSGFQDRDRSRTKTSSRRRRGGHHLVPRFLPCDDISFFLQVFLLLPCSAHLDARAQCLLVTCDFVPLDWPRLLTARVHSMRIALWASSARRFVCAAIARDATITRSASLFSIVSSATALVHSSRPYHAALIIITPTRENFFGGA